MQVSWESNLAVVTKSPTCLFLPDFNVIHCGGVFHLCVQEASRKREGAETGHSAPKQIDQFTAEGAEAPIFAEEGTRLRPHSQPSVSLDADFRPQLYRGQAPFDAKLIVQSMLTHQFNGR